MSERFQKAAREGLGLDLLQGLRSRRSVYHYEERTPDLALLKEAIELATLAPNHYKTQPWRFVVIHGEGRESLAAVIESTAERLGRPLDAARARAFEAPAMVLVSVCPQLKRRKVLLTEETLAVAAATQNLMLALHGMGLGSLWTTGPLILSPEMEAFAGLSGPNDHLLGMILVGYPNKEKLPPPRPADKAAEFIRWVG